VKRLEAEDRKRKAVAQSAWGLGSFKGRCWLHGVGRVDASNTSLGVRVSSLLPPAGLVASLTPIRDLDVHALAKQGAKLRRCVGMQV
jgi:hypothetical protein